MSLNWNFYFQFLFFAGKVLHNRGWLLKLNLKLCIIIIIIIIIIIQVHLSHIQVLFWQVVLSGEVTWHFTLWSRFLFFDWILQFTLFSALRNSGLYMANSYAVYAHTCESSLHLHCFFAS